MDNSLSQDEHDEFAREWDKLYNDKRKPLPKR